MTSEIIPLYECDLKVGDQVRLADPDGDYEPDQVLHVLGVEWRHQRGRVDFGWNITVASADDIAKGYGATDGYRPEHLIPVLAARPTPEAVIDQYIAAGRRRRDADDLRLNSAAVWMADDEWEDAKLGLRMILEERTGKIDHMKKALSECVEARMPGQARSIARAALRQITE